MDGGPAPRLPSATLVGLAALALGLGGWRWASNPPPAGSAAATSPAATSLGHGAIVVLADRTLERLLPPADEPVLRTGAVLGPQARLTIDEPGLSDGWYLLEITCHGRDGVDLVVLPTGGTQHFTIECARAGVDTAIVIAFGLGYTTMVLSSRSTGPATVAFQLRPVPLR